MIVQEIFTTKIILEKCNIDLHRLLDKCLEYKKNVNPYNVVYRSNRGGAEQCDEFYDEELYEQIFKNIPALPNKPIKNIQCHSWVNYNPKGSWNDRHAHDPHNGNFLSGVFYVKVPENSGNISFIDPRPHISTSPEMVYYNDGHHEIEFVPEPNLLMMFPSWLEHSVCMSNSDDMRISISFNLHHPVY